MARKNSLSRQFHKTEAPLGKRTGIENVQGCISEKRSRLDRLCKRLVRVTIQKKMRALLSRVRNGGNQARFDTKGSPCIMRMRKPPKETIRTTG